MFHEPNKDKLQDERDWDANEADGLLNESFWFAVINSYYMDCVCNNDR